MPHTFLLGPVSTPYKPDPDLTGQFLNQFKSSDEAPALYPDPERLFCCQCHSIVFKSDLLGQWTRNWKTADEPMERSPYSYTHRLD